MKMPTVVVVFAFVALGMLNTKFSNEVACETCQWMPVGTRGRSLSVVDRGISVRSKMKLRIWRKNWFWLTYQLPSGPLVGRG